MTPKQTAILPMETTKELLGYLNFSSGNRDPKFFQSLDALFSKLPPSNKDSRCSALRAIDYLEQELSSLAQQSEAFHSDDQAGLVLGLVRKHFFPAYRQFHADLLFHQNDELLFNSFFLGRVFESVLQQGAPWEEPERIVSAVITKLCDYIGYRPVPVLEGEEKHQPYTHEWVAPIPLYIKGIGTAAGKYQTVVEQAFAILRQTDPAILQEACLDPDRILELVLDPRAYDFDHPVNRKPNYHFGLWDPNAIDSQGFYNRFVVHQVTIDGIMRRLETAYTGESTVADVPIDELLFEAGAVLAGTMLMGAGVCGDTPSTYDSETSLNNLMPIIADYRDKFYNQLIGKIPTEKMKRRIQEEQKRLFQPFGGCRQDLNRQMAKRRADQLQRMHLARIFAQMGYSDAAMKQATAISVTSARLLTTIDCLITETHQHVDAAELIQAAANLPKIEDIIRRGIACGSLIDPWTILGFGGAYSLFHTIENSIHDHRIDEMINLLEGVFDIYSRVQKEAAASGNGDLQADLSDRMSDLAGWWDQFGTTDVSNIDSFSGEEAWESAAVVSTALAAWHKAGTAAGDIAFWSRHVERFKTTKAFVLLAEALLDQHDPVASMNLMMYWLEHADKIPLVENDYSFHAIAVRWMESLWKPPKNDSDNEEKTKKSSQKKPLKEEVPPMPFAERWKWTRKFFESMEANADKYWHVPDLHLDDNMFRKGKGGKGKRNKSSKYPEKNPGESDDDIFDDDIFGEKGDFSKQRKKNQKDDSESIYGAAYDDFTYKDSTDDGIDDSLMDQPPPGGFNNQDEDLAIVGEMDRIGDRLLFISTMSKLWKFVTERLAGFVLVPKETAWLTEAVKNEADEIPPEMLTEIEQHLNAWLSQMTTYSSGLSTLLQRASEYEVPPPRGTADSLIQYDRHRGIKEILLDRVVWTHVEVYDTQMTLEAYLGTMVREETRLLWETTVFNMNKSIFRCDVKKVKKDWNALCKVLSKETILYVPTSRGGSAASIVKCRQIQQAIIRLLEYVPRLGLVLELFKLLETIQLMEERNTINPGAITEFDRLVETASRAVTKCVAASAKSWKFHRVRKTEERMQNAALVDYMEQVIEHLLSFWLSHSKQIRISPVESITDKKHWFDVQQFIQRYGHDIFTQQNMGFGNIRAILHQGVSNYLKALMKMKKEDEEVEIGTKLLEDLENKRIHPSAASDLLEIILESIAENYSEYVDYNSTTTHSDHGEKLYMLLDMLRVQVGYERISWNLKPVYWVHDSMIRVGCDESALLWEKAVAQRSVSAAEEHLRSYQRLCEKYGMWLPSVHERLQERFIRPLQIDRMCGLVPKAIRQAQQEGEKTDFIELYAQIENFAKDPMGVGFEMPEWLSALRDEVMSTRFDAEEHKPVSGEEEGRDVFNSQPHFEQACITKTQLDKIIQTLGR